MEAMREAENALKDGDSDGAVDAQGRALDGPPARWQVDLARPRGAGA